MIQVNRIYLIFNRLVTKKFLVDTSDSLYQKGALINEFSRVIGIDKISDFKKRGIIGTDIRFLKYLRVVCNNSK